MKKTVLLSMTALCTSLFAGGDPYASQYGICAHVSRGERAVAPQEFDLMNRAGIRLVRTDFDWKNMEKKQGEWNVGHLDSLVALAREKKVGILPILDYDVPWARPAWKNLDQWTDYVRRTVGHYGKDLPVWEVWNEQNHEFPWGDKADGTSYAVLLKATYETVKAVNPNLKVLYGGTAGIPFEFIENSLKNGAAKAFDAMNIHPYRLLEIPEPTLAYDLQRLQKLLAKYDAPREVWVTELGWTTNRTRDFYRNTLNVMLGASLKKGAPLKVAYVNDVHYPFTTASYSFDLKSIFPDAMATRAVALTELAKLDPAEWPILIPTVDESFPMAYFEALESFVKRGGVLILPNGVPLYYDLRKKADGSLEKVMVDDRYRQRLHLGWTAWWKDKKVPNFTGKAEISPEFRELLKPEENHAEIYLTAAGLKEGDSMQTVISGFTPEYKGATAAIYHLGSDLKGKVLVISYKGLIGCTTEEGQAELLPRGALICLANGVSKFFWYELQATESVAHDRESHFGIVHKDLSPKPAFAAYRTLIRMRPDGSTAPVIEISADDVYTARWKRPDGKAVTAVWSPRAEVAGKLVLLGKLEQAFDHLGETLTVNPDRFQAGAGIVYLIGPENASVRK